MLFETLKAYLGNKTMSEEDYYPIKAIVVNFYENTMWITDDGDTTVELSGDSWVQEAIKKQALCAEMENGGLQISLLKWRFTCQKDANGVKTVGVLPEEFEFSTASPEEVKLIRSAKEKDLLTTMISHEDVK